MTVAGGVCVVAVNKHFYPTFLKTKNKMTKLHSYETSLRL